MSDAEPRRSVRSTKGQHKSLDHIDQATATTTGPAHSASVPSTTAAAAVSPASTVDAPAVKKRGGRKGSAGSKKAEAVSEPEDESEEEIIRCVCGATEQDGDPGEPWIACDICTAWQHNVCMGMSVYSEDLPKEYFCEKCKPENHEELLEAMARGEKPWEDRRRLYEEEKANGKKRKGGRRGKGKRNSDVRDHKEDSAKPSPTPESRKDLKAVPTPAGAKRKTRGDAEDQDGKKRKLSDTAPRPKYNPPSDLAQKFSDLPDNRQTPTRGLAKFVSEVLGSLQRRSEFSPAEGTTLEATAEMFAIQIERAVYDAHPMSQEYAARIRTVRFNIKENHELCARLLRGTLTPPMLATMTSDQLASRELQQKTAEMKAQAERQIILGADDGGGPRLRRTHKGEEIVERDGNTDIVEEKPSVLRRAAGRESHDKDMNSRRASIQSRGASMRADTKADKADTVDVATSARKDFDVKKVLNAVGPSNGGGSGRRSSHAHRQSTGTLDDPDVDRMLVDEPESPPYSPKHDDVFEETPDVLWRGNIAMSGICGFPAIARHIGGVNLYETIGLSWKTLLPKMLTVAGRIDEKRATEYLCSLRYSAVTDISVASISPAVDSAKGEFLALFEYFSQRSRYGVVAERGVDNVRDTYLVPVPAGNDSHPEFMLNLEDNFIPSSRSAPMLLLVIVYKNEPSDLEKLRGPGWASQHMPPTPGSSGQPGVATGDAHGADGTGAAGGGSVAGVSDGQSSSSSSGSTTGTHIAASGNVTAGSITTAIPAVETPVPVPNVGALVPVPQPTVQQTPIPPPTMPTMAIPPMANHQPQRNSVAPQPQPGALAQTPSKSVSPFTPTTATHAPFPLPLGAVQQPPHLTSPPVAAQQQAQQALPAHQPLSAQATQANVVRAAAPLPSSALAHQAALRQNAPPPTQQIQPPHPALKATATPPPLQHPQPIPPVPVAAVNVAAHQHQLLQQARQQSQASSHQPGQLPPHLTQQRQMQFEQQYLQQQRHHIVQQQQLQTLQQHRPVGQVNSHVSALTQSQRDQAQREQAQRDGEAAAREILGPLATCPAAGYLMTQAAKMQKNEWLLVRSVFEKHPRTRDDLQLLKIELESYNGRNAHNKANTTVQPPKQNANGIEKLGELQQMHASTQSQGHAATATPGYTVPPVQTPVPIPQVSVQPSAEPSAATKPPLSPGEVIQQRLNDRLEPGLSSASYNNRPQA